MTKYLTFLFILYPTVKLMLKSLFKLTIQWLYQKHHIVETTLSFYIATTTFFYPTDWFSIRFSDCMSKHASMPYQIKMPFPGQIHLMFYNVSFMVLYSLCAVVDVVSIILNNTLKTKERKISIRIVGVEGKHLDLGWVGEGSPRYYLILEGSIKWFVFSSCGVGELEPGQLWVEVLFIIFPPVGSHERALETVDARRRRSGGLSVGYVKHIQSLSLPRGLWSTKHVPHLHRPHNGNSAGQWRRRERPAIKEPLQWNGLH